MRLLPIIAIETIAFFAIFNAMVLMSHPPLSDWKGQDWGMIAVIYGVWGIPAWGVITLVILSLRKE